MKYIILGIIIVVLVLTIVFLYLENKKEYDIEYGISFSNTHASSLGLDWKRVYEDMLRELRPKYIRIAAPWNTLEPTKGEFDFADIDWQMDMAAQYAAKVVLVIGQKAPRWPECHVPNWLNYTDGSARKDLLSYVQQVVARYKDHEALELWQIENEPFIRFQFGECENFDREAIYEEIELVKRLDSEHKIVVTDSGELGLWWGARRAGDIFGTTLYRIVQHDSGRIFDYDWLPAVMYKMKAKMTGVNLDNFFVSELQAEPWFVDSTPLDSSVQDMEKTMNPERLQKHIDYVRNIGASRAYLWGVEWWYFMKEKHGDARYWKMVKEVM